MLYSFDKSVHINKIIHEIENNIEKSLKDKEFSKILSNGLLKGKGGIALFYFYFSRKTSISENYYKAIKILLDIIRNLKHANDNFTFHSGVAGIGWLIEHLKRNDFIDSNTNHILSDIDKYLGVVLKKYYESDYCDFLYGSLGLSLYFIKRNNCDKTINFIINRIIELRLWEKKNFKWIGNNKEVEFIDLGLAHGISSIICILCKLYELRKNDKVVAKRIADCLSDNINYLMSITNNRAKSSFSLPNFSSFNKSDIKKISTLGWTHGDLPVGISMYHASRTINNKIWENEALEIIKHSCRRNEIVCTGSDIHEISLCIGTSGVGHIYHKMYLYTEIEMFKETAINWFDKTIEIYNKIKFKNDNLIHFKKKEEKIEFLYGQSGVGLALISAISNIDSSWDECLLLS